MRRRLGGWAYWTGCCIASGIAGVALYNVRAYGALPMGVGLGLAGCVWMLGLATQQLLASL